MNKIYTILREIEQNLLTQITTKKYRETFHHVNWQDQVISIYGERGIGKTYLLLQKRKSEKNAFYFSADSHLINSVGLFDFVYWLQKNHNITQIYIDEIHKYPEWIQELKNIIDSLPQIKLIITGSSGMMLYKGTIDLGRRIRDYHMKPLSFQEYMMFSQNKSLQPYSLKEIFQNFSQIITENAPRISETNFLEYLSQGFYPYGINDSFGAFSNKLNKLLDKIIQDDMLGLFNFTRMTSVKLQKLFYFLATTSPSEISIQSLAKKIGTNNDLLGEVLAVLNKIGIINLIEKHGKPSDKIRKHNKIFLGNPNMYKVNNIQNEIGTIRESFFLSQMRIANIKVEYIKDGDYAVTDKENTFLVEIGGKNKTAKQLKQQKNSFVVIDDFYGTENKIPLWLFGLLKTSY